MVENNLLLGGTGFPQTNSYNDEYLSELSNMKSIIDGIVYACKNFMSGQELVTLNNILNEVLNKYEILSDDLVPKYENFQEANNELINRFSRACAVEGKSKRTIEYYLHILELFLNFANKPIGNVTTQDIRDYLAFRKETNDISYTTMDNIRRVLSTCFGWFHEEKYILKNPAAPIKKIKDFKKVKNPLTPREIELLRYELHGKKDLASLRDVAIFELLLSSGIRVGELVQLNIHDMDFEKGSFIVLGKGNKERECYFNAKAQLALEIYLKNRKDDNPALFVATKKPYKRLTKNAVERRMRDLGKRINIKVYPHLLRKTFATDLLRKDVPIEQVQRLLGHEKLETTTIYAIVDDQKLNHSHKKLLD